MPVDDSYCTKHGTISDKTLVQEKLPAKDRFATSTFNNAQSQILFSKQLKPFLHGTPIVKIYLLVKSKDKFIKFLNS